MGPIEMIEDEHPRGNARRASDQRLQIVADSPLLKVVGQFITLVLLPIAAWTLMAVWSELRSINDSINKTNTSLALYEYRISTLESQMTSAKAARDAQIKGLQDKQGDHETRINLLERGDRTPVAR